MPRKKRHSAAEIAAKVAQADELSAQGKLQSEIATELGVSVMTLHRWRKMLSEQPSSEAAPVAPARHISSAEAHEEAERIAELKLENSRLRRLVTDLMLEKLSLEEAAQNSPSSRRSSRR